MPCEGSSYKIEYISGTVDKDELMKWSIILRSLLPNQHSPSKSDPFYGISLNPGRAFMSGACAKVGGHR